jgi:alanine dehydrogenase
MIRLVRGDDVDRLASSELGLAAARETAEHVAAGAVSTGRVQTGDTSAWMRILGGIIPSLDLIGYKEFHRVGKHVYYHVSLFRHSDGTALGVVDGRRITSLRTSSTAALAVQHACADEPVAVGVIGSGEEAREGLRALAGAMALERVTVFSPTAANREAFAAQLGAELDLRVTPAASVMDVAYVATAARAPVLCAADVASLRIVAAVGATHRDHHELGGDVVAQAREVVVDCHDATLEPGDMIDAIEHHGWEPERATLLGAWLRRTPSADDGSGPLLFKSIGSVEQDLVLAHRLLVAAAQQGLGQAVDPVGTLRVMR